MKAVGGSQAAIAIAVVVFVTAREIVDRRQRPGRHHLIKARPELKRVSCLRYSSSNLFSYDSGMPSSSIHPTLTSLA
jgi:hypothetical protein